MFRNFEKLLAKFKLLCATPLQIFIIKDLLIFLMAINALITSLM